MTDLEKLLLSGIVGVLIVAVVGVGWYSQTSSAELTDQEVYRIIKDWHEDNPHLFVSQDELVASLFVMNDAIAAPHIEFNNIDSMQTAVFNIRDDIQELKIEIAKLKIQQSGTGTPSQGTISVSVSQSCYERGDVITFEGMATPSRQLTSSIYKDKSVFEASPTTNTNSNGSFTLFWVIPDHIDIGTYI